MTDIRDIQIIQRRREENLRPEEGIPGVIRAVGGSATVAGRTNYIWVSLFNQPQSLIQVLNLTGVSPVDGNLVVVGKPHQAGLFQVLRIWDGVSDYTTSSDVVGALSIPAHHQSHQFPSEANPGPDVVYVFNPALMALKTVGNGVSLTVTVYGLPSYRYGATYKTYAGNTLDLTSSRPGTAGQVRFTLVYLDGSDNTLKIVDGTAVVDSPPVPVPKPALPENGIASAYVRLTNGQTAITTATHVVDAREFLAPRVLPNTLTAASVLAILVSYDDEAVFYDGEAVWYE